MTNKELRATLFIKGLDSSVKTSDLERLFGDIGPLKSCFVVINKETNASKNIGYVRYTLLEDAKTACEKLNGKLVKGQKIAVTYSLPKIKEDSEGAPIRASTKRDKPSNFERPDVANMSNSKSSSHSVAKNDNEIVKPVFKKVKLDDSSLVNVPNEGAAASLDPSGGRTLIIADIPPECVKDVTLYKIAKKIGPLESVEYNVPVESVHLKNPVKCIRAKIVFENHKDARKAALEMNGLKFKKEAIVAFIMTKSLAPSAKALMKSRLIVRNLRFKASEVHLEKAFRRFGPIQEIKLVYKEGGESLNAKGNKISRGYAFIQYTHPSHAQQAIKEVNGTLICGRLVAVDLVLPKETFLNGAVAMQNNNNIETDNSDSDSQESESGGASSGSEEDDEEEKEKEVVQVDRPVKEKVSDTDERKTVFVRNLSYITSEEDLSEALSEYGELAYCKVVVDAITGKSKGSGFAKFKHESGAAACVTASSDCLMINHNVAEGSSGIVLHGRSLTITMAVDREKALKIKEDNITDRISTDKRCLHLAKEGRIYPNSDQAVGLSKNDLAIREKAWNELREKMKNTNYYFNELRLLVRNIPTAITETQLESIFEKHGKPPVQKSASGINGTARRAKVVRKVIIMRDRDKKEGPDTTTPITGVTKPTHPTNEIKRSLGFGFVEFHTHEGALRALREINNNPEYFRPDKRLCVEFVLENVLAKKAQELNKKRQANLSIENAANVKPKRLSFKEKKAQLKEKHKKAVFDKHAPTINSTTANSVSTKQHAQPLKREKNNKGSFVREDKQLIKQQQQDKVQPLSTPRPSPPVAAPTQKMTSDRKQSKTNDKFVDIELNYLKKIAMNNSSWM